MGRYNNFARNARIIELRKQGLWPTQIADAMEMSRNAVLGVLNRAGLCSGATDRRAAMRLKAPRGEASPHAKLTSAAVADIRTSYAKNSRTHGAGAFARKYGVHYVTVWLVIAGRTWREAA